MNRQQLIYLQNFRLKNEITDLRNALSMNRDFLKLLSQQEMQTNEKINLLYKIILRLTQQSDQALLSNLQLIQEKDTLKHQIYKLNQQLDHLQAKLQEEIERNNKIESLTQSKIDIQEQLQALNNQLMASHEEQMTLEQEIEHWKYLYNNAETALRESTQPEEPYIDGPKMTKQGSQYSAASTNEPKRRKISRKYVSNMRVMDQQKVQSLEKSIKRLNQYIDELEARLHIFIKAYNYRQNVLERKQSFSKRHPLNEAIGIEVQLLKYAMNEIRVYQRHGQKFMMIRHNFRESETNPAPRSRHADKSWPKHKQFNIKSSLEDQDSFLFNSREEEEIVGS